MTLDPRAIAAARTRHGLAELLARDGVALKREGREWSGLCPFHREKSPSFRVYADGHYHCFGCGAHGDAIAWRMARHGEGFLAAVAALAGGAAPAAAGLAPEAGGAGAPARSHAGLARALWRAAAPIAGTPGEGYFRERGLRLALPASLRFAAALEYGPRAGRVRLPGIVAAVQNAAGAVVAVHRIFLDPASVARGRPVKAKVARAKALLGSPGGGAVRLAPVDCRLGLAEGIETALAVMQALPGFPVWAAIAAPFLAALDLPAAVTHPVLLADRDAVSWRPGPLYGRRAGEYWAARAARRFHAEGRHPTVAVPPGETCDFDDLLREAV